MSSLEERPKLPTLDRLKELRTIVDSDISEPYEAQLSQGVEEELVNILDWLITEIENRRFRYKKQWTKQKMLARVGRERLSKDELQQIDRAAEELALQLTEQEEHERTTSEGDTQATETDQGDSGSPFDEVVSLIESSEEDAT